MPLYPKTIGILEQSVKTAGLRHQVIANNIANVNVPGFQAAEVRFEDQLREALQGGDTQTGLQGLIADPRHIPINASARQTLPVEPRVQLSATGVMRQDGNTVDIEAENAKLAANQLWYQALVRSVSDEFTRLRTAINEGRR